MNGNANPSSTAVVSANNNANVANSANKRKFSSNRSNSTRGPRNKGAMDRSIVPEGIYSNARFMNVAASVVGCIARIVTVEGFTYEGIFRTFSSQFEVVISMGHKVDENSTSKLGQLLSMASKEEIEPTMIFKLGDVSILSFHNVDLDYAAKDMFATDSLISKFNGQISEKELEPWDGIGTESESLGHGLDMDNANGWDPNDMFRTNEQQYGVQSSYDSTLSGYTTQLEKKNTDEYKKQEAKAFKLASEIESSSNHRARTAIESVDEDEKISAVVRPGDTNNCVGNYVPPHKRTKNQQAGKLNTGNRSNSASQGGYGMPSGGRVGPSGLSHVNHSQLHVNSGSVGGGNQGSNYNRPPHSNSSKNLSGPASQHHSVGSHTSVGHYQNVHRHQTSPPGLSSNLNISGAASNVAGGTDIRKTSPHHHHHLPPPQSVQNSESDTRLSCDPRVEKLDGENVKSKQQSQHSATVSESARKETVAVNEPRNEANNSELCSGNSVTNQHQPPLPQNSNQNQLGSNHIQPKLPKKPSSKVERSKEVADLKTFQTNFNLPLSENKEETSTVTTPVVEDENKDKILDSDIEKSTNGVKKFTLNPNAKEFVLNPNAKAFTPRSSSAQTPTPPRAHTPGAMMTQQATISLVPGSILAPMPHQYMMPPTSQLAAVSLASPMNQAAATALAMHQGGGARFRKNENEHYTQINTDGRRYLVADAVFPFTTQTTVQPRPDFSHVAAATGQPILAPTGLTSQASFVQYQSQAMVAHGAPQHNMPYATQMYSVLGPRLMTAQGMSVMQTPQFVQHADPQHVPSQMFLSAHPGVPQLTQGPNPSHTNHNPIPNMSQGNSHNASSQGQPQQSQVTSMHPNPSPVHGNPPTQPNPNNQPQSNPNNQQLSAYSAQHAPTMTQAQLQGAQHTPNSPQSMHPGQVNNSNTHYLAHVAHPGGPNASPHANQAHHPSQGGFSPVVILPSGPGTPTSITGHPTLNTHSLHSGHALGHGGVAQLVPPMVIPATSAGQLQAATHQIFMSHHNGRPNALQSRVMCAVPPQQYQL